MPLLFLTLALSWAGLAYAEEKPVPIKTPESWSAERRENLLSLVPKKIVQAIPKVQAIFAEPREEGGQRFYGPNCHWGALAFYDDKLSAEPRFVNFPEYEKILEKSFRKVKTPQAGDLVVAEHRYKEWVVVEDRHRERVDRVMPIHSAVILKDDVAFQKDSPFDALFSLDTLEGILKVCRKYVADLPPNRSGSVHLVYHRLRKMPDEGEKPKVKLLGDRSQEVGFGGK